jgi:[acyl-carrier-protein] S-malonyltransferase
MNECSEAVVVLCPGQGAQAVGMGRAWCERSAAARTVFAEADQVLGDRFGERFSTLCFEGPAERLNRTDIAQPAIYTCSVASYRGLLEQAGPLEVGAAAGLSLGEYTALYLAGTFEFRTGLDIVALRGRLMQDAADASEGTMVALTGADETQAEAICVSARGSGTLVAANFNAPGQIVLSGERTACEEAALAAERAGLRATPLAVAGAFHSPLMQPAADALAEALAGIPLQPPQVPVWANVTARPHDPGDLELLRDRLVQQIVSPVQWSRTCQGIAAGDTMAFHELAPGSVLRGLMRRIDRQKKVTSHDEPDEPHEP